MCDSERIRVATGPPRTTTTSALRLGAVETELPATWLGGRQRGVEAADRPSPPPPQIGEAEAAAVPEKRTELDPPPPSSCLRASFKISAMPPPAVLRCPCISATGALPCFAAVRCPSLSAGRAPGAGCRRAARPPCPSAGEVRGRWRVGPCWVSLVLHWVSSEEMHIQFDEHRDKSLLLFSRERLYPYVFLI
jgi:hypothetical protein